MLSSPILKEDGKKEVGLKLFHVTKFIGYEILMGRLSPVLEGLYKGKSIDSRKDGWMNGDGFFCIQGKVILFFLSK